MTKKIEDGKYLKAGIGYTIGNYLIKGLSLITLPIFLRLMTTAEYGDYSAYCAYETLFSIVMGLALHASLKNAKYKYKLENEFNDYLAACMQIGILSTTVIVVVANICFPLFAEAIDITRLLFNLLLIQSYAMALMTFYNSYVSLEYRYKSFFLVSLLNALTTTGLSLILILTVYNSDRYTGRVVGTATPVIAIGVGIALYFLGKSHRPTKINIVYWKFGITFSAPIILHGISQVVLNQFDRIMIRKMSGAVEAGVYSFSYNIYSLILITSTSLQNVWAPWFYERMSEKNYKSIREQGDKYAFGMLMFVICVLLMAPEMILILGTEEYSNATSYLIPLLVSGYFSFLYSLPAQVEYYFGKTNYIAGGTCAAAVLNIVMNYFGISNFGSIAAAYTTLIIYCFYFCIHYLISVKIQGYSVFNIKKLLMYSTILMGTGILSIILKKHILVRWGLLLGVAVYFFVWLNREFSVVEKIKRKFFKKR